MTTTIGQQHGWRRSPWRLLLWAIPTGLLILPAVAMQFTEEVQWTGFDFVFAFVLLFGTTGLIDLAIRKGGSTPYRLGAGLAVMISFLLVWINGAVGIIGNEDNPANLVYIGQILIAAVGSVMARFEARGMMFAMFATATVQALVTVTALVIGLGAGDPPGAAGLAMLNGVFLALWLISAGLFRMAAHQENSRRGQG